MFTWRKKIFDGWWLYAKYTLAKTKEITGIKKFGNAKILMDTDDKLPDNVTFKNVAILMSCKKKMMVNVMHNYFGIKHCFLNKHCNNMWWQHYVRKNIGLRKRTEWYYFERLKKALIYIKSNLTDSHNKYLTVDSLT